MADYNNYELYTGGNVNFASGDIQIQGVFENNYPFAKNGQAVLVEYNNFVFSVSNLATMEAQYGIVEDETIVDENERKQQAINEWKIANDAFTKEQAEKYAGNALTYEQYLADTTFTQALLTAIITKEA